jgi:CRP/FNR family transcriptional regulator
MDKLLEVLQDFNFTEAQINQAKSGIQLRSVKSNVTLIDPYTTCTKLFFILEGGFVCRKLNPNNGDFKTINFFLDDLHPFMTCVDSYFTGQETVCELRSVKECTFIEVSKDHIDELVASDRRFLEFYTFLVTRSFIETVEMKQKLISLKPIELYQDMITHFPQIIKSVPAVYIAEFIGISAEWLSKLKNKLKKT